jgi:hypothetical protein
MVGVVILGITIAALCGGFSLGFRTIKLSQEDVRADQILMQKLESVRVYNWSLITNNYIPTNFTTSFSTATGSVHGVTYDGTITVAPFSSATGESYTNTLRQITASISWFSGGLTHTRTMMTLISQNGIQTYTP